MKPIKSKTLKAWRKDRGLTQREAARVFGISQQAWCRYENGDRRPKAELARKLIHKTGVSAEEMLGIA